MSVVYMSLCLKCKHRIRTDKPKDKAYCKAYPNGVPVDVWREKSKPDYDKDTPCPNGCKFEHD